MYATIQRLVGRQGAATEALRTVSQLAAALSRLPGFVSFALMEADGGIDIAVMIFETAGELAEATRFAAGWAEDHLPGWLFAADQATSGEIVVQRGI
ncbi:MAG TPA: hypothetical protein VKV26_01950 [Dehalococcoidia bacterium]|nr:hypothetical protein [Dehalococcoidia bacterium]